MFSDATLDIEHEEESESSPQSPHTHFRNLVSGHQHQGRGAAGEDQGTFSFFSIIISVSAVYLYL